jgi:hypothetical protein
VCFYNGALENSTLRLNFIAKKYKPIARAKLEEIFDKEVGQ